MKGFMLSHLRLVVCLLLGISIACMAVSPQQLLITTTVGGSDTFRKGADGCDCQGVLFNSDDCPSGCSGTYAPDCEWEAGDLGILWCAGWPDGECSGPSYCADVWNARNCSGHD